MKTVEVSRGELENIFEAIDGVTAVLDLVINELDLRYEQKESRTTHYQLKVLLEMVDFRLGEQWEHIRALLNKDEGVTC